MIIGILLGVALATFLASLGLIIFGISGDLTENFWTGAVVGVKEAVSYSLLAATVSLIAILALVVILAKKKYYK